MLITKYRIILTSHHALGIIDGITLHKNKTSYAEIFAIKFLQEMKLKENNVTKCSWSHFLFFSVQNFTF